MSQRSQALHNFVMPTRLKWGNQRHLRCMKSNPNSHLRSYIPQSDSDEKKDLSFLYAKHKSPPESKIQRNETDVIEDFRAKLLLHLPMAAEKTVRVEEEEPALCGQRKTPWNLRTRRSACKAPVKEKSKLGEKKQKKLDLSSPQRIESLSLRLKRLAEKDEDVEKKERRKFSVSLSPDEIKEDFLIMTGNNPSRRPKKRAKLLQKQFDILSPGFWLNEITVDSYRLPDELVETKR